MGNVTPAPDVTPLGENVTPYVTPDNAPKDGEKRIKYIQGLLGEHLTGQIERTHAYFNRLNPLMENAERPRRYDNAYTYYLKMTKPKPETSIAQLWAVVDGKRTELKEIPEGYKILSDGQVWSPENAGYNDLSH